MFKKFKEVLNFNRSCRKIKKILAVAAALEQKGFKIDSKFFYKTEQNCEDTFMCSVSCIHKHILNIDHNTLKRVHYVSLDAGLSFLEKQLQIEENSSYLD